MSLLETAAEIAVAYVALYPIVTASIWIAGGLLFRSLEERIPVRGEPAGGWSGVSILIPAYNEAEVIHRSVRAARAVDYPELEILVLDDGSSDGTAAVAEEAADDDPRVRVLPDPVNRGKAERLNIGLAEARHDLILVIDADATLEGEAVRKLVRRISRSPRIAGVAGAPMITNRGSLLAALQVLEFASIIGLIRRTQALGGRVGVVAGIVGMFRRQAVLEVGGYDGRMATEDIELTYRLLLAGWETDYEPSALVGMEVPASWRALWMQRKRWARGQGEVLNTHGREILKPRHHRVWVIAGESLASVLWLTLMAISLVLTLIDIFTPSFEIGVWEYALAWGIAIAVIAALQLAVAMSMTTRYDRSASVTFLLGPLYPAAYWGLAAAAALRSQVVAIFRGPRSERVVWDMPRESSEP